MSRTVMSAPNEFVEIPVEHIVHIQTIRLILIVRLIFQSSMSIRSHSRLIRRENCMLRLILQIQNIGMIALGNPWSFFELLACILLSELAKTSCYSHRHSDAFCGRVGFAWGSNHRYQWDSRLSGFRFFVVFSILYRVAAWAIRVQCFLSFFDLMIGFLQSPFEFSDRMTIHSLPTMLNRNFSTVLLR